MKDTTPNRVTVFLEEREIPKTRLASLFGISTVQFSKYVCGARRLNVEQRRLVMSQWPRDAEELFEIFDDARKAWESRQPLRVSRPAPKVVAEEKTLEPEEEDDGKSYTIEEWKARFGEPGPLTDVHGRVWEYFSTEPDFCE